MATKECRIDKIKSLLSFNCIKKIVKDKYDYTIEESSVEEFFKYINEYEIDEIELLRILENESYTKMAVLRMKKLKSIPNYPVCDEILNPMFLELFKTNNNISSKEYDGELGTCYQVVYYNESKDNLDITTLDINIACVRNFDKSINKESGEIDETKEEVYDSARFIIDINNKLVYMFYNDWPSGYNSDINGYTEKKKVLYNLFKSATRGNLLSFVLSDSLTEYFNEYYQERSNGKSKKIISLIECTYEGDKTKAVKLTDPGYKFQNEQNTLDEMYNNIKNNGYHISVIECLINGKLVRIKEDGSISVSNGSVCKEVIKYVCKKFIKKDATFYEY